MARYVIDPRASRFTARAFAGGALSAIGHNPSFAIRDVRGEVELDAEGGREASLNLTVKAESLALTDNVSDKDRQELERAMREDVLETSRFPEIVYASPADKATVTKTGEGQFQVRMNGDLSLHGETRSHPVIANVFVAGDLLRGSAETSLRQSDFGIKLVSAVGGMLKVKEEVKLTFDFVARKQD
ncbi:MAG TPA: YceI family protein [Gemmatimonadales bacterium]